MRRRMMLVLAGGALLAVAPGAHAQDGSPGGLRDGSSGGSQAALEFVGTPSVRYAKVVTDEGRFWSLAAVGADRTR